MVFRYVIKHCESLRILQAFADSILFANKVARIWLNDEKKCPQQNPMTLYVSIKWGQTIPIFKIKCSIQCYIFSSEKQDSKSFALILNVIKTCKTDILN